MNYRAFGQFTRGYAHVKNGTGAEDYAGWYNDPDGRYCIAAACDGHSDKNCFRSAAGARFGCESAIETLIRFFDAYYEHGVFTEIPDEAAADRLKRSVMQNWEDRVFQDIAMHPVTPEELVPLSEAVRTYYEAGKGLENIYGATLLVVAVCEEFFLSFQIGDGVILCISKDGSCTYPLPEDPKGETGAPASLCDRDLFTRECAFRIRITKELPLAAAVSSDGIEDCMDAFAYRRFVHKFFQSLKETEDPGQQQAVLNAKQEKELQHWLEHFAGKGNGAEDDCSLAGVYNLAIPLPEMKVPLEEAVRLWEDTARQRNDTVRDYERRKKQTYSSLMRILHSREWSRGYMERNMSGWLETRRKAEALKETVRTILANEKTKTAAYDHRLQSYASYITAAGGRPDYESLLQIDPVDESPLREDAAFVCYDEQAKRLDQAAKDYELAVRELNAAEDQMEHIVNERRRLSACSILNEQQRLDFEERLDAAEKLCSEKRQTAEAAKKERASADAAHFEAWQQLLFAQSGQKNQKKRTEDSQNPSAVRNTGTPCAAAAPGEDRPIADVPAARRQKPAGEPAVQEPVRDLSDAGGRHAAAVSGKQGAAPDLSAAEPQYPERESGSDAASAAGNRVDPAVTDPASAVSNGESESAEPTAAGRRNTSAGGALGNDPAARRKDIRDFSEKAADKVKEFIGSSMKKRN